MRFPAVAVFVQPGCGACEEFVPRFSRIAAPLPAQGVGVHVVDISKFPTTAQQFKVNATPTTVVLTNSSGGGRRLVGAADDAEIVRFLRAGLG